MGSQVDDALDRLARLRVMLVGVLNDARPSPDWSWEILHAWDAMCEERERLREERDAALDREAGTSDALDEARTWKSTAEIAGKRVGELEAEVRQLRAETRAEREHRLLNETRRLEIERDAAEASVRRLTEGLREFAELGPDSDLYLIDVRDKARALLSASPSDGGGA